MQWNLKHTLAKAYVGDPGRGEREVKKRLESKNAITSQRKLVRNEDDRIINYENPSKANTLLAHHSAINDLRLSVPNSV